MSTRECGIQADGVACVSRWRIDPRLLAWSNRAAPDGDGGRGTVCWRAVRKARRAGTARRRKRPGRALLPDCPGLSCFAGFSARTCSSAIAVAVAGWCWRSSANAARSRPVFSASGCRRESARTDRLGQRDGRKTIRGTARTCNNTRAFSLKSSFPVGTSMAKADWDSELRRPNL